MLRKILRFAVWTSAFVLLVAVALAMRGNDDKPTPGGSARYVCTEGFKRMANDPSSVSFDDRSEWVTKNLGGGDWSVTFGVRAKNAFGGLVHAYYICVTHDDGNTTRLVRIDQAN